MGDNSICTGVKPHSIGDQGGGPARLGGDRRKVQALRSEFRGEGGTGVKQKFYTYRCAWAEEGRKGKRKATSIPFQGCVWKDQGCCQ